MYMSSPIYIANQPFNNINSRLFYANQRIYKKQLAVIGTACAITLLPAVAEYIGVNAAEKFNFLTFYGAGKLLSSSFRKPEFLGGVGWTAVATVLVLAAVMILTLISALKWCGEKRK